MRRVASRVFNRIAAGSRSSAADYHALPEFEAAVPRRSSRLRRLKWTFVVVGTALLMSLAALLSPSLQSAASAGGRASTPGEAMTQARLANLSVPMRPQDPGGSRRLRIFMPADAPHLNLCKAVMSAVALGYPAPMLLNWGGEFNRPEWHLGGSHIAKMESLLAVIEHLLAQAGRDDDGDDDVVSVHDLAVMVDAYDTWFQLPPGVLIERFHRLNREADERVRRQWHAGFPVPAPRQAIVVSSAKDCHPGRDSGSDAHYAHWPASPMPPD
ncbi:Uncharacterized protein TPAR_03911, partial [Tolypocladium paradoxum]